MASRTSKLSSFVAIDPSGTRHTVHHMVKIEDDNEITGDRMSRDPTRIEYYQTDADQDVAENPDGTFVIMATNTILKRV